jgi:hypothetical protein
MTYLNTNIEGEMLSGDLTAQIPLPVMTRLYELKDLLCHAGTIIVRREKKRKVAYRLRVRLPRSGQSRRKMIAIKLPDEKTSQVVTKLLTGWRLEHEAALKAQQLAQEARRQAELLERQEEKEMLRLVAEMAGDSSWTRRRVRKEFSYALQAGPIASALYVLSKQYLRCPEKQSRSESTQRFQGNHLAGCLDPMQNVQEKVRERFEQRRARWANPS